MEGGSMASHDYLLLNRLLTLIVAGLKIYVNWRGGVFNTPPLISLNKAIFGPKNHETILSHVRGALLVCFGSMKTP